MRAFGSRLMGCWCSNHRPGWKWGNYWIYPNPGNTAGYNKNTGDRAVNIDNSQRVETNQNGVTTTKGRRGGEAKTKNGMGVVQVPNGKICVSTRHN